MFGHRTKDDVVSAEKVFSKLSELYKNEYKRLPLDAFLTVKENTPSSLTLTSEKGTVTAFERFLSLRSTARSTPKRQKADFKDRRDSLLYR